MKRKPIPKETRQKVWEKYQGRCAYCGKEIKYEEMQVDHAIPFAGEWYGRNTEKVRQMIDDNSINDFSNLMPACRACNFYKGGGDIESLRYSVLNQLSVSCRSTFQTRLAIQYGMIEYHPWDGKFYFEKQDAK
jgi:predicted RNA-binding Zn-ribbon protein involved in translation (DUF1610 family)